MTPLRFAGGGSLDGREWDRPAGISPAAVVTTERDGGRSWYVLDDSGGYQFAGLNDHGAEMAGMIRAFTDALAGRVPAEPEPVPRPRPRGCAECGLVFAGESAWSVHLEDMGEGRQRCMPVSRYEGTLREVDGVWCLAGFER